MRHAEEVGMAVHLQPAVFEDDAGDPHRRGIHLGGRRHFADLRGGGLDAAQRKRPGLAGVHVGEGPLADDDVVDPPRVECLEQFLPALRVQRDGMVEHAGQLGPVHMDLGVLEFDIGGDTALADRAPVQARRQARQPDDRPLEVRGLQDDDVTQV